MLEVGLILLAAGNSSRLGSPKQLLPYSGTTLLQHAMRAASASKCAPLLLVLGANADSIYQGIDAGRFAFCVNDRWSEGMASSIRYGLEQIRRLRTDLDGVLIMGCDQPFISSKVIDDLLERFESLEHLVVASKYGQTIGIPAVFHESLFPDLNEISGDKGAKSVIHKYDEHVSYVDFPRGEVDIDTGADYEAVTGV